ncbi:MAG: hypothetical protein ACI8QS_003021 [Planctomycetota bacterium]|jgi:hypothetical protein
MNGKQQEQLGAPQSQERVFLGTSLLTGAVALAVVWGCAEQREWTPFVEHNVTEAVAELGGREVSLLSATDDVIAMRDAANAGCMSCHEGVGDPHGELLQMGCIDCHGGDGLASEKEEGHPAAMYKAKWPADGANPAGSYTLLNDEKLEWIRFVNPGDLRVSNEACGTCHPSHALHVAKSIMTTGSHFYGVAPYANGILQNKASILGESYSPEGVAQAVFTVPAPTEEEAARGVLGAIFPPPHFEVGQTANIFRVFEKGSRLGTAALGFNGLPVPLVGIPDKFEDPGRPNNRLSDRGLGTLNRVDLTLLNVFKTRLNDPLLSFMGTNDQPGDFRSSGCTACHVVYANDRDPVASGPYAKYGNTGTGNISTDPWGDPVAADPVMPTDSEGHPLQHKFTRSIPSSQCMTCHHHQPNSFVNSYLGFTMWNYESDAQDMWPEEEQYPSAAELFERFDRNPEGAAGRGLWGEREFLDDVAYMNPELDDTQFADYHGHGWIFRGAFKMDHEGNLLDSEGNAVPYDSNKFEGALAELGSDPSGAEILAGAFAPKEGRAVHLKDIHAERGMHCVDCHFSQDSHGDGKLYSEYQAAVEIRCQDCHGSLENQPTLVTSGPAAAGGDSLSGRGAPETPWSKPRFERLPNGDIIQRSMLYKELKWTMPVVTIDADGVGTGTTEKADYAHGQASTDDGLAHGGDKLECYACHSAWITSCFGCHLPQQANWKTEQHHFEGNVLRNYATYNPQVVRDSEFMLGVAGNVKGNVIAPVRSSSAVMISSMDALRQQIYSNVPTIAANGMSSQIFNTHFPHTVRTTETRGCAECHVSKEDDNNAWLAQTYLLGTNYVNFMGQNAFVGTGGDGFEAVRVAEVDEPQAVIGSNLHRMAYPDRYAAHREHEGELQRSNHHGGTDIRSLQLRGEYLYTASGEGGFRVYDVANVNNKGFSEKMVTSPVSPLGQDTHVSTKFATAVALPTNNHITMSRTYRPENEETPYEYNGDIQNMHESYRYAYISDRYEGLVIVDIDSLSDFDPQNNFLERSLTFNPDGILDGAENLVVAGETVYVCCDQGIVAVDIDDPMAPRVIARVGGTDVVKPTSIAIQFRFAFVTDANGLQVLDVTKPAEMRAVPGARVELADARNVYVARTYAYVSAGAQGLVIIDVKTPADPKIDQIYTADGAISDLNQVKTAMTNDSFFAYLADGENGMHILQLVTPEDEGRSAYGFTPRPRPALIASYETHGPAMAISEGLHRDRAVDESGNQMAAFGRIGGRPMNTEERERLFLGGNGNVYPGVELGEGR